MALTVTQAPDQTIDGVVQAQPGTISGVTQASTQTLGPTLSAPTGTNYNPQATSTTPIQGSSPALQTTTNPQTTVDPNTLDPNTQINTGQGVAPATALPTGMSFGTPQTSPAETAFNAMKASGTPAPQDSSSASGAVTNAIEQSTPPQPFDFTNIETQLAQDPGYQQLLADRKEYDSLVNQNQSLTETYSKLSEQLGIPALNTELMNMKNIIEGSEDDIRNEVTKAGGFATDSQVLALTNARNKQMIKNYNNLLNTKTTAQDTLNTMIGLAGKDREFAMQAISQKMQFDQQINDYRQKMQDNARQTYNNIIEQVGYAGLAQMTGGNPYYTSLVEKTLGLSPGGLSKLATYKKPLTEMEQLDLAIKHQQLDTDKAMLPLDIRLKQAQIANIQSEISNRGSTGSGALGAVKATPTDIRVAQIIASNPSEWGHAADQINSEFGAGTATKYDSWLKAVYQNNQPVSSLQPLGGSGTGNTPQVLAQAQGNVNLISGLLTDKGLNSAVGPNPLARMSVVNSLTGTTGNFLAGVQQLTSQLTIDALQRAKAGGATFGALSDKELALLAGAATKLNTWAIKDANGNVTGYNTTESNFRAELDKINNFAKMDYILKGGNAADVGVQQMPDGTYWTQNSNGTMTKL